MRKRVLGVCSFDGLPYWDVIFWYVHGVNYVSGSSRRAIHHVLYKYDAHTNTDAHTDSNTNANIVRVVMYGIGKRKQRAVVRHRRQRKLLLQLWRMGDVFRGRRRPGVYKPI